MPSDSSSYVARLRAQGLSQEAISYRLTLAGWSADAIRQELGRVVEQPASRAAVLPAPMPAAPQPASRAKASLWHMPAAKRLLKWEIPLFALLTLVFVGAGIAGVYFFRPSSVAYSISLPAGSATSTLTYGLWPALADPHFYDEVKNSLIEQKTSFISADLAAMSLTVYKNGEAVLTVPIVAKGKIGSWWETPVGLYEINSREESHFSSFGKVYQPWSLAFQGNFFIHGIPFYPNGTEVASSYSGGCIRLSTEDARAVYEFASVGMPVMVYDSKEAPEPFKYQYQTPELSATAFIAADIEDGTVLASNNSKIQLPIASVTKLMTALVTVEYLNLEKSIVVPQGALVSTTVPRLRAGKEYTVHDLLILMLTESSNEAAEALARALGRDYFITLMNKKAGSIGLSHTTFIDPSGLGVGNSSTAEDMFTLIKYIHDNRSFLLNITNGTVSKDAYGSVVFGALQNFNKITGIPNEFLGGKIGTTNAAKETYVGLYNVTFGGSKRPIAAIVLGADDAQKSIRDLLSYLNEFYEAQ